MEKLATAQWNRSEHGSDHRYKTSPPPPPSCDIKPSLSAWFQELMAIPDASEFLSWVTVSDTFLHLHSLLTLYFQRLDLTCTPFVIVSLRPSLAALSLLTPPEAGSLSLVLLLLGSFSLVLPLHVSSPGFLLLGSPSPHYLSWVPSPGFPLLGTSPLRGGGHVMGSL